MTAVSVVIPVLNGARHLRRVLRAVAREVHGRSAEIIIVDDGCSDGSRRIAESFRARCSSELLEIRVIDGPRRGAAAAMNAGIRDARYPFICQIDQDVAIEPHWLTRLLRAFDDPHVAAVQGRYVVRRSDGAWARLAGRDLDVRYSRLGSTTDHVCTGNVIYRARALHQIGLFDESLGYGYDNDVSYRLVRAGYRLAFCPGATAHHCWRTTLGGYCRHQFGVGYGRLDVVRLHPRRVRGDAVSRWSMMAHAPVMLAALLLLAISFLLPAAAAIAIALIAALAIERAIAGARAWRLTGDRITWLFPVAHFLRDAVWAYAIVLWVARRAIGIGRDPAHSMQRPRAGVRPPLQHSPLLVLVPAYNEGANLPRVVEDVRAVFPAVAILVINDASTDDTQDLLPALNVEWLTLPERLGVGGALRAGLRWARRHGYDVVARVDGDGQHRATDLRRLLRPIRAGRADASTGSRYLHAAHPATARGITQRALALSVSMLTRRRVTDPTSGLWILGPRAVRLLVDHHPGGYPEPELHLLLAQRGLRVREVAVDVRARLAGRTTLTPGRAAIAFARTAFALLALTMRPYRQPAPQ